MNRYVWMLLIEIGNIGGRLDLGSNVISFAYVVFMVFMGYVCRD